MAALRHYAAVDSGSRVEGATPHQLVRILFDELLLALDTAALALKAGDRHKCLDRQTRALAILHALETSLDFEQGGEIAISLATIYRETRRRTLEATVANDPSLMESAHGFIAEIASAWKQIG
ncbi:flagellar protein FliS [Sphingobium sp. B1D7B]|uniref:flagellar export chaperone FliS n=1 Tax=Sphingobium TaxID=165695 RepID=UPI00183014C7|nr:MULTISPECIES: flagellar export chaperone FliS [Sphingobium]MCW2363692.1 flagellar protein FliS [Sphingobium sp. B10D3B]MCW2392565.1 flagellar protein FliS [Sphingobium sp. B11D3A]MCW2402910.1 flagellar protein FliS [Sphingobium sp. B10D7B]MCW2404260.1 flagellar protein FliS [Sphingobium sp. B1D7B]MCW2409888.1 flagellar protein FliS [Sphingobium xanthum]